MEDRVVATSPGARIPVSPAAWQAGLGSVVAAFTQAETTARLAVTKGATHAGDVILLRLFLVGGAGLPRSSSPPSCCSGSATASPAS